MIVAHTENNSIAFDHTKHSWAMACFKHDTTTGEMANPIAIGEVVLDGDEDAQVVVYEDGAPTWWALQQVKWRLHFHIPDDFPSEVASHLLPRLAIEPEPLPVSRGQKRLAEEAGLETN